MKALFHPGRDVSENLTDLIGNIYDAALAPQQWSVFLERLAQATGAHNAIFRLYDNKSMNLDFAASVGLDDAYIKAYHDHGHHIDPWREHLDKHIGEIIDRRDLTSDSVLRGSAIYNEFLKPYDSFHILGGHIIQDGDRIVRLGLHGSEASGGFDNKARVLMEHLVPHIKRAVSLNRQFEQLAQERNGLERSLNRLSLGVVLLNGDAEPVFISRQAEAILKRGHVVCLDRQELQALDARQNIQLKQIIQQAIATGKGEGQSSGGALNLRGPSDISPVSVVISPISAQTYGVALGLKHVCAAVFISTPDRRHDITLRTLSELYGLTSAESRLARELINGSSLDDIAKKFSVSKNTLRSQLRAIFRKTDTSRQAELTQLVLNGLTILIV